MASQIQTLPGSTLDRSRTAALAAEIEQLESEALARYRLGRLEAEVLAPARGLLDAEARLRSIVSGYVSLAIDEPGLMPLFADGGARLSAGLRQRIEGYLQALETDLTEVILTRTERSKTDPVVAAFSLLGIVHWGVCTFRADGRLGREEAVEQISRLALHGLEGRPQGPGGPDHRKMAA